MIDRLLAIIRQRVALFGTMEMVVCLRLKERGLD